MILCHQRPVDETGLNNGDFNTMRNATKNLFCLTMLLTATGSCFAWGVSCPGSVRLDSAHIAPGDVPAGFQASAGTGETLRLTGASMFEGSSAQGTPLKPAANPTGGSPYEVKINWEKLNSGGKIATLSCDYAYGIVRLLHKVDPAVNSCTAIYQRENSPNALDIKFQCK